LPNISNLAPMFNIVLLLKMNWIDGARNKRSIIIKEGTDPSCVK